MFTRFPKFCQVALSGGNRPFPFGFETDRDVLICSRKASIPSAG